MNARNALLATADGEVFRGRAVGVDGITTGEAVFNTSMTGYQEILTDPSYAGQVVVMTAPHIGNYGTARWDEQSRGPAASGFVVRALSRRESNWRSEGSLADYFKSHGVVAVSDIDTRRLTRHLRENGAMPVAMGNDVDEMELVEIAATAPDMIGRDLATQVSTKEPYRLEAEGRSRGLIAAIDLGMKTDILRNLTSRGFDVEVYPAAVRREELLALAPRGVFISNGPGDPEPLVDTTRTVRSLIGNIPIFGICLGHQVLGLAFGAQTYKLPFGHHGGNHPVRSLDEGTVEITAQNHGFAVDLWSLTEDERPEREGLVGPELLPSEVMTDFGLVRPTHQNLNDGTLEGMSLDEHPVFSVQYHPEAAPGPSDARPLFDSFVSMMERAN